ncbi:hypothetical protein LP415_10410 [Polaromonas sp. P1(28)-8]|nr:hypothetical protein LP415_10410 [Polaromonas sp. P1(28)-8]
MVTIKYADLLDAFEFVSFGAPFDSSAFICVDTGVIYCTSDTLELDEEVPEDLGNIRSVHRHSAQERVEPRSGSGSVLC